MNGKQQSASLCMEVIVELPIDDSILVKLFVAAVVGVEGFMAEEMMVSDEIRKEDDAGTASVLLDEA
jgi:hypothetical protein